MTCKLCGKPVSYKDGATFVQVKHSTYHGDHDEIVVSDAGLFCSGTCAASYLTGERRVMAASEGRQS